MIAIEASEAEPNDTLAAANRAPLGAAIVGSVGPGESDWFAVDVPAGTRGMLVVNLTVGDATAALGLYDEAGQTLGIATTYDALALRKVTLERRADAPRYMSSSAAATPRPATTSRSPSAAERQTKARSSEVRKKRPNQCRALSWNEGQ